MVRNGRRASPRKGRLAPLAWSPMLTTLSPAPPVSGVAVERSEWMIAGRDALITWAPAKVNVHLEVTAKRADGYHEVETLVLAVDLFDTLEVQIGNGDALTLDCDFSGMPTDSRNLVIRAANALRIKTGTTRGARIRLSKRIPAEAGLGGGSSDAATALLALNRLWELNLTVEELRVVAAEVGSDVGVFLTPPAGWCTGRGEVVEPETPGGQFYLVIVKPAAGLSTPAVYRQVKVPVEPRSGDAARAALRAGDPEALARTLFNRLQEPAFELAPAAKAAFERLASCDPLGTLLSGSGSSLFAICRDAGHARNVAARFRGSSSSSESVFVVRSYWPRSQ